MQLSSLYSELPIFFSQNFRFTSANSQCWLISHLWYFLIDLQKSLVLVFTYIARFVWSWYLVEQQYSYLRIHRRLSTILKTSKKMYEVIFFDMKKYVYSEGVFNKLYTEIKQMLKKIPSNKINSTKNALFLLSRAPAHHSFTFNLRFLYALKHKISLSKIVCRIFHFRLRFLFIKVYIFVQQKTWTLKRHIFFQN